MFWNRKYPYTDFSSINLDWLVRKVAELVQRSGLVRTVAGIAPDAHGNISADKLAEALDIQPSGDTGIITVTITDDAEGERLVLDKTWKEIHDAVLAGMFVYVIDRTAGFDSYISFGLLLNITESESYTVNIARDAEGGMLSDTFTAASENGYPEYDYGE